MKLPPIVLDCLRGASGAALALAIGCGQATSAPLGVQVNAPPSPGSPTVQPGSALVAKPPDMQVIPAAQLAPAPPVAVISPTPPQLAQQPAKRPRRRVTREVPTPPGIDPGIGIGNFPEGIHPACGRG